MEDLERIGIADMSREEERALRERVKEVMPDVNLNENSRECMRHVRKIRLETLIERVKPIDATTSEKRYSEILEFILRVIAVREIIKLLAETDELGNNVLHILVGLKDFNKDLFQLISKMYRQAVVDLKRFYNMYDIHDTHTISKDHSRQGVLSIVDAAFTGHFVSLEEDELDLRNMRNKQGLTPFQKGILVGNKHALEILKDELWHFDLISRFRIEINLLDPILMNIAEKEPPRYLFSSFTRKDRTNAKLSAVEIAVLQNQKDIIDHPVVDCLLRYEWQLYARDIFLNRLFFTLLTLLTVTTAIALQPFTYPERAVYSNIMDLRCVVEVLALIEATLMLSFGGIEISVQGIRKYVGWSCLENLIQWSFCLLLYFVGVLRFGLSTNILPHTSLHLEILILGIVSLLRWTYTMTFAKGFERIGPLVLIFWRIVSEDLLQFLWVYATLTMGFSTFFFLRMREVTANTEDPGSQDWGNFAGSTAWLIRFSLQQANYDQFRFSELPVLTEIAFLCYGIIVIILLVNILVAKVCQTFNEVSKDEKREWKVQLASLILGIDSHLPDHKKWMIAKKLGSKQSGGGR
ncbi:hypothetical protein BC830DRAFT_661095 [Chytriomyces sp. MP71]|nr:hypothetical protein BC830DRAFT_661095 [Chytriomyces sp. MP71]